MPEKRVFKKAYLEITNRCNLQCSFCHGTARPARALTADEFDFLTDALRGRAEYLYFHLLGEPLTHPLLPEFIEKVYEKGFHPMLTTNGTLIGRRKDELLAGHLYKASISLHAPEANGAFAGDEYLENCALFAQQAGQKGIITALRLWNEGGLEEGNGKIIKTLHEYFPGQWAEIRSGWRIGERVFIERGRKFTWPDMALPNTDGDSFCYGLRDHLGILADGTVVPCCLDAEGNIALGNLFSQDLDEILSSPRAQALYAGFTAHRAEEALCRRCGYARQMQYRGKTAPY